MKPFSRIPAFESLDSETIPDLGDLDLAAATCVALDTLHGSCPGGIVGMLELLDPEDSERLRDALWTAHLVPHVRRVPDADPWPEATAPEIEECAASLVRQVILRERDGRASLSGTVAGLGDTDALSIACDIEDWQNRYPSPI